VLTKEAFPHQHEIVRRNLEFLQSGSR
jgi:hypothetical protein